MGRGCHFKSASYSYLARILSGQKGLLAIRQGSYEIRPGDSFKTTCNYRSYEDTVFGLASADEMCEGFLLYYPAKRIFNTYPWGCVYDVPVSACNATVTSNLLAPNDTIKKFFGSDGSGQCTAKIPDAVGNISALAVGNVSSLDPTTSGLTSSGTDNNFHQRCLSGLLLISIISITLF